LSRKKLEISEKRGFEREYIFPPHPSERGIEKNILSNEKPPFSKISIKSSAQSCLARANPPTEEETISSLGLSQIKSEGGQEKHFIQ